MVNFLSTFYKNLRQLLIPIYGLTKKHARFTWTDKHQKAFDDIKQLLVKPPVLRMVSGNGFFRLESDTSRTAAGATLYQWQNNEWVLVGYHSKRLPDAVRNYGVTELELTGLLAHIHGFEQKLNNNYFEAIVDHKAIDYLIKSKHEPTSTRLVTLLDRLNRYTFDLKYLEGSKLKVSDALSRLYSEEKHKISDVIPLNFLLHFTDYQLHKESDHLANKLYAHKRTKLSAKARRNYDRQAKHKPVDRYEPQVITKKANKVPAVAKINEQQYAAALQEIPIKSLTRNENPLKKLDRIDKPLTIKQDQQEKQVINTIREVPPEMYTPAHLLILPQDKLSLFRKHIPKQQEIDALLKNLRRHVLHNLMVNLDTKDLIESYTKSLRYREIYNYVADGRLPGNATTQKKIAGEAANYVVVNGLLFKIAQHKESGKWTHYLLLVIPEKFEANILNMYHNSLLAMHQGPYRTFLTMRKQFYFPNMDEYKFVNPSAPPACIKAFSLPPAHPNQIHFQPPTLPQDWGDKGAEGKQKLAAQMTAWITTILIVITLLAILYTICKKCRYVSSLPRVCFPLYPFSTILRGTARTDIFVEVVNLASAEAMWAHFASVAVHPSQLRITGYPRAYDMHIIKLCCCRQLQVDWQNIILCDLDQNIIKLPTLGKISLWSTNDLESIEANIPYQIRVYGRVLDLIIPLEVKDDVHITDHRLY